jgi:hypothetical protein
MAVRIMDARDLRTVRTCGVAAQDWTNDKIYRKVAEVKEGEEVRMKTSSTSSTLRLFYRCLLCGFAGEYRRLTERAARSLCRDLWRNQRTMHPDRGAFAQGNWRDLATALAPGPERGSRRLSCGVPQSPVFLLLVRKKMRPNNGADDEGVCCRGMASPVDTGRNNGRNVAEWTEFAPVFASEKKSGCFLRFFHFFSRQNKAKRQVNTIIESIEPVPKRG